MCMSLWLTWFKKRYIFYLFLFYIFYLHIWFVIVWPPIDGVTPRTQLPIGTRASPSSLRSITVRRPQVTSPTQQQQSIKTHAETDYKPWQIKMNKEAKHSSHSLVKPHAHITTNCLYKDQRYKYTKVRFTMGLGQGHIKVKRPLIQKVSVAGWVGSTKDHYNKKVGILIVDQLV